MHNSRKNMLGAARSAAFVLAAASLGFTSAVPAALAQPASAAVASPVEVVVNSGKSQVIQLPTPYADVMVADPKVADVLPLNNRSVYVIGKTMGSTAVTIYGPGKKLITSVNVVVSADIESLKSRLAAILPNEKDIAVSAANQSIVLSGTVSNAAVQQQALALAESYAPTKVVNTLAVEGTQQVMLSVRFVEMERNVAKDLQLNLQSASANPAFSIATGDTINGHQNVLDTLLGTTSYRLSRGKSSLDVIFDALEEKRLVKTLAEPNLVANSGDTASFLAGGEFPIPVQQTPGSSSVIPGILVNNPLITVEFKQFGIALGFTPTILRDGLINVAVNPEVSDIDTDPTHSINVGNIRIPGIKVRRAHTTVELHDGESFTIAGLLKDNYTSQVRQYPFVGDLPVIGALFKSNGYQRNETELVIVVTPHLVTAHRGPTATPADNFTPPSDFENFLLGKQEGSKSDQPAAPVKTGEAKTGDAKAAVDGPHGHVLY